MLHEFRSTGGAQPNGAWRFGSGAGNDAINPSPVDAERSILRVRHLSGHPFRMLDHIAVVVEQIQCSIGTDIKVHRPKPWIVRSQKLDVVLRTPRGESGSGIHEQIAVNQVMDGFGHE